MIFFRVTSNINIKATDGSMVSYFKFRTPSNLNNETAYITTYDDFNDLKAVFKRVDEKKFLAKVLKEKKIRQIEEFPLELGISNTDEYINYEELKDGTYFNEETFKEYFLENQKVNISEQVRNITKEEVSLVIIGGIGKTISEMVASCTALRILHSKLNEMYKRVKIDIYLDASNNSYYSRDKSIYERQDFINKVNPLSISVKKFTQYDFFIDNSSFTKSVYFKYLNYVDAWLYKFGIDYENIPSHLKYNYLNLNGLQINDNLSKKIKSAKQKGKLLLYHPYSADATKSIPQTFSSSILKELINKYEDYTIISALVIDSKIKDDRYIDLSKDSKSLTDFMYIVSQMDKVLSVDTSTYHISDSFMIPTLVLFTKEDYARKIKYYNFTKSIFIKDKSKSLSKFIFESEDLTVNKFESWKKLKISKIIELLDSF